MFEKIPLLINTIVLDIDGTILNSNNDIQDRLPDIIKKLCKSSINIMLASARPILSVAMIGAKLSIDCPFVGLNGGIVANSDRIYWTKELIVTPEIYQVLMSFKEQVSINYYYDFKWMVNNINDSVLEEVRLSGVNPTIDENYIPKSIQKILLIGDPNSLNIISDKLKQLNLNCTLSKSNYLEVTPLGVDKVIGIKKALDLIGSDKTKLVMAIGDGENDIPMFEAFDYSVAMGNASNIVKQKADLVIEHCNNNGLTKFLEQFYAKRVLL